MESQCYLSAKDIMQTFSVSKGTAYRWINLMQSKIQVGAVIRVPESEVQKFVESYTIRLKTRTAPKKVHPDWPQPTQPRKKVQKQTKVKKGK